VKTAHAAEQDRPDIAARREAWFDVQPDLYPEQLIFIDECGASAKVARMHGRAPAGRVVSRAGAAWLLENDNLRRCGTDFAKLLDAIRDAIDAITPSDARSYFTTAGHEPE
jgi:hypothetical protein